MRKILIIVSGILVGIAAAAGFFIFAFNSNNNQATDTPILQAIPTMIPTPEAPSSQTIEFKSPSGFIFSYPDDVALTDNTKTDTEYATLALSKKGNNGIVTVSVVDTTYKTVADYLKDPKQTVPTGKQKSVPLRDVAASDIADSESHVIAAVDQGVFYLFKADYKGSKEYWDKVLDTVAGSFAFAQPVVTPASSSGSGAASSGDIIFEGEETVE